MYQLTMARILALCLSLCIGQTLTEDAKPLSLMLDDQLPREGKTLLHTFPFNIDARAHAHHDHHAHEDGAHHGDDHHGDHGEHHPLAKSQALDSRSARQGEAGQEAGSQDVSSTLNIGEVAAAGERCVEKVMMIEETEYDDQIECHHSYDQRCHTTYTTDYVPQQEEECEENFKKDCYIEYKVVAFNETVEICNQRPVRNCDKPGPTVCETVYESECQTTYHEHEVEEDVPECRTMQVEKCREVTQGYTTSEECDKWPKQICTLEKKTVKRYSPETDCVKKPRDVCGPGPCPLEPGPKECRKDKKTVVQEVPEETCNLNPHKVCKFVTKLVPSLKPTENCVEVPKEVCTRVRVNPRKIKKPVIKKWCYVPTEESGLDNVDSDGAADNSDAAQATATDDDNANEDQEQNSADYPSRLIQ